MLAVYPNVDGDAIMQARLLGAYVRRQQFQAKLIALEVGKLFSASTQPERVSADEIMAMMGITAVVVDGH